MIKGLIGKKLGMLQLFQDSGETVPVTVIEAGPCPVLQIKTREKEGYEAVQVGYSPIERKRIRQSVAGKVKDIKDAEGKPLKPCRMLKEFAPLEEGKLPELGQQIDVSIFDGVSKVKIQGRTKGRGFQGVMRRHGNHGGRATHGSHFHRAPGSVGMCAWPAEVKPGMKMPGQYGNTFRTVKNLTVEKVDVKRNLIFVRGAIPGPVKGTVFVYRQD